MAGEKPAARRLELGIERLILGSRWLQAPLYLGLLVVLAVVVIKFPFKIWELMQGASSRKPTSCWPCCRWSI